MGQDSIHRIDRALIVLSSNSQSTDLASPRLVSRAARVQGNNPDQKRKHLLERKQVFRYEMSQLWSPVRFSHFHSGGIHTTSSHSWTLNSLPTSVGAHAQGLLEPVTSGRCLVNDLSFKAIQGTGD